MAAAPFPAALPGTGDLADPVGEDEDDGVAAAGRRRSGETGEPRSAKTSAFRSDLCLRPRAHLRPPAKVLVGRGEVAV
jgi:hypothetical protein